MGLFVWQCGGIRDAGARRHTEEMLYRHTV